MPRYYCGAHALKCIHKGPLSCTYVCFIVPVKIRRFLAAPRAPTCDEGSLTGPLLPSLSVEQRIVLRTELATIFARLDLTDRRNLFFSFDHVRKAVNEGVEDLKRREVAMPNMMAVGKGTRRNKGRRKGGGRNQRGKKEDRIEGCKDETGGGTEDSAEGFCFSSEGVKFPPGCRQVLPRAKLSSSATRATFAAEGTHPTQIVFR